MGRWSRLVAHEFVPWLAVRRDAIWLDVGCGTGALAQTVLDLAWPGSVAGVDISRALVDHASAHVKGARFEVADARSLPFDNGAVDVVASALLLNFLPEPAAAVAESRRVARAAVAGYVWDYAGQMQMLRIFWDTAAERDPAAAQLDDGLRCEMCNPEGLSSLFRVAGLHDVQVRAVDVNTVFRDFDDFWTPFLSGQEAAPTYCLSLSEEELGDLRDRLRAKLPFESDGSLRLIARSWAVRGRP